MFKRIEFIRDMNAGDYLEYLFISAISSIFVIRFYLRMTGYPQLGNRNFHFAHMLWGGFFMLAALIFLISFMGNKNKVWAAVLGGIGFGFFVDELGKFVTRDNNYFYQPTIAILYVIFLFLFFLFRYIEKSRIPTKKEYLMNALELLKEAVLNDMDEEEKKTFDQYLKHTKKYHYLTAELQSISDNIVTIESPKPSALLRSFRACKKRADTFITSLLFQRFIVLFFIWSSFLSMARVAVILSTVEDFHGNFLRTLPGLYSFTAQGQFISTSISAFLAIVGIFTLRLSRYRAYTCFKYSTLVSILLTQFFSFYQNQFHALISLGVNIVVLLGINYVIAQERSVRVVSYGDKRVEV